MQALIDPNGNPRQLTSWTYDKTSKDWVPVFTDIPDASSVAQVQETTFEVAAPLFWTTCAANVVAYEWYYQNSTQVILPVPAPAPIPTPTNQPVTTGAQTI